jgi:hypothetical protein
MMHKALWVSSLALLWTPAFFLPGASLRAAENEEKVAAKPAAFTHIVLFRLTKDAPEGEVDSIIADCHGMLGKISTVRDLKAGRPSDNGTKVAKKDYQVGLLVLFDDADGLKSYLDDKLHVESLKKHGKYLDEKLEVFDFQNQAK